MVSAVNSMTHGASYPPPRSAPGPLRLRRLALGLRQSDVALLAGCSREQIVRLEAGDCVSNLRTAAALAQALNADLVELFPSTTETPLAAGPRERSAVVARVTKSSDPPPETYLSSGAHDSQRVSRRVWDQLDFILDAERSIDGPEGQLL